VVEVDAADPKRKVIQERPWWKLLHFDTSQFPHVQWDTPEELGQRVLSRIRANGWDEPRVQSHTAAT
jgi:hypothetical protein